VCGVWCSSWIDKLRERGDENEEKWLWFSEYEAMIIIFEVKSHQGFFKNWMKFLSLQKHSLRPTLVKSLPQIWTQGNSIFILMGKTERDRKKKFKQIQTA
jgi:hypothetical protein